MTWLFSLPGKLAMAALALALAFGAGYLKGKSDGRIDQLKDSVEAYENRNEIDRTVGGMDAYERCLALGGMPDQCDRLRRLDTASEGE